LIVVYEPAGDSDGSKMTASAAVVAVNASEMLWVSRLRSRRADGVIVVLP
jgi:hypothetical protein